MISFENARWLVYEINEDIAVMQSQLSLSDIEIAELNLISTDKRKREYLAVRIAFEKLLGEEIKIIYNEDGKPLVADNSLHLSISHSKNWIAVIAHPTNKVGIDIECVNEKVRNVFTRFLSPEEQSYFSNGSDLKQLQIAWSAKEALYKIIGKQAVDFANHLRIHSFLALDAGELKATHNPTNKFYQLTYLQNSDYTLVYCVDSNIQ